MVESRWPATGVFRGILMPCVHKGFHDITWTQIEASILADRICRDWYREGHSAPVSFNGMGRQWNVPLCRVCGAPPKWFVFSCHACSNIFIRDFIDARFCFCESYCWNHLSESPFSPTTGCLEHSSTFSLEPDRQVSPSGLNERLIGITAQEYSDILDELGIDF